MSDEVDFESAKPMKLAHEHDPQKTVDFFKGEEPNKLQPRELTEEMLQRYYDLSMELDLLSKQVEMLKGDIKDLGKGSETMQKGPYIAMFKAVKGRTSVKWDKLAKDLIGKISDDDLAKYTDIGDPSVRLEVRRLS